MRGMRTVYVRHMHICAAHISRTGNKRRNSTRMAPHDMEMNNNAGYLW